MSHNHAARNLVTGGVSIIRLQSGTATAEVALRGAELRNWTVGGTALLWQADPAVWADTSPILFPIVGWTRGGRIAVAGVLYPLGLHGFVREHVFHVLEQWPSHVRLGLAASAETRRQYPFAWRLEVEYALDGPGLSVALTVENLGTSAMPYACGLHPGFRWPFAGGQPEDYEIVFGEQEAPSVPIISAEGLFTRQSRRIPLDGRRLPLSAELLADEALCFIDARSSSLRFSHGSGAAINVALEDFPHIALWSRPKGRFLSIEAWTGHGDLADADGDLFRKPSMRHLPAGGSASHGAKFSFVSPHLL